MRDASGGFPPEALSRMSIRGGQVQGDNTLPYLSPRSKEVWYLFEGPPIAPWPDTVGCWWSWCRSWGNECKAIRPYPVCYPVPYYTCERESELTRCEFPWNCIGGAETVEMEASSGCVRRSRYSICGPCKCKAISPYPICRSGL